MQFPAVNGLELELSKPQAPIPLSFETVSVTRSLFWHKVYLGIGSNLGDKKEFLDQAVEKMKLDQAFRKLRTSDWIVTEPYGGVEQDDFLNGAIEAETFLSPDALLHKLHAIEQEAGRERKIHWGPRTLDLDILLYDHEIIDTEKLTIPHIDMQNRQFVLEPLSQLAPAYMHPVLHKTISQLLAELLP